MNDFGKFEQYINEGEISQSRTSEEYICWFEKKLAITRRTELKRQNLLHKGIAKEFYEELFPLYRLLQNKAEDWKKEKFTPVIGKNYDVEVQTDRKDVPRFIEITTADMDKEEYDRMQRFLNHGSAPKEGWINEQEKKLIDKVRKLVNKKMTVPKKPDNTALLIYFDDYMDFRFDQEASKRKMDAFLDSIGIRWGDRYTALYVVGASGQSFFERSGEHCRIFTDGKNTSLSRAQSRE